MTEVEVDEVLGLVRHEAPKVAADDAVPGRSFPLVELLPYQTSRTRLRASSAIA